MTRLLFLGLSRLSKGDAAVAVDFARQLPRARFQLGMVATEQVTAQLRDQGMPTLPLDRGSAAGNLAALDRIVRGVPGGDRRQRLQQRGSAALL
jgi:hypothetical protein